MAKLTAKGRKRISKKNFALPATRSKSGGKGGFPIHDKPHGIAAMRMRGHASPAQQATIKRKVCAKYPTISSCGKGKSKTKR